MQHKRSSSPGGTAQTSPALKRWVRRDGPGLTQHVRRIVRNAVSPQQLNKLFLIIPPGMMRRLILDVGDDAICLRCAHAEGAITFLPGETRSRRSRVIEPFRRTTLYRLHRLRERHRWGHNEESVNVIGCAADLDGFESMIFCNARSEERRVGKECRYRWS